MSRIVWIASYPKSGSTWLRVFLTNFGRDGAEPADIDHLDDAEAASSRHLFERTLGIASAGLGSEEIAARRPDVYRALARASDAPLHMKVHDAYTHLPDGRPLLPPEATRAALYVVRNPLDVAAAGAPFIARDLDVVLHIMADEDFVMSPPDPDDPSPHVPHRLFSWSGHVRSWTGCGDFPVHVVRYEDMSARPEEAFTGVVRFLGLPLDAGRIRRAIEHSRFEVLRAQELRHGFRERPDAMHGPFFRKGRVGSWREELSAEQVRRLVGSHRAMMQRFGYLDESGEPR